MDSTTTIRIGSIRGNGGELSISYLPEDGRFHLFAYDPGDRRKAGVYISLTDGEYQELKNLIFKVDEAVEKEVQHRLEAKKVNEQKKVSEFKDSVSVSLSGASVSLPLKLYEKAAALISEGKTVLAASLISQELSWLGLSGAKEIAETICLHQQKNGLRK
jgi:hypothetical protein